MPPKANHPACCLDARTPVRQRGGGRRRRIKSARFPVVKSLDEFDFAFQPSLPREKLLQLKDCRWVAHGVNLLLKTVAYLRVSTRSQDLANQKLAILEFSQKRRFPIDQFIESRISSRKSPLERRIDEMLGTLQPGDRLLVSELSRLGRSLGQVIQIVETLVRRKIRFIAIKEAIEFDGKQDLRTKVMIALFGLFAEVERDLISERTKEGLAAAKAKGKLLGRPKGALGTSRLDGKEQDIRELLGKDVSKASIAKILDVSRSALYHFIQTRKIAPD